MIQELLKDGKKLHKGKELETYLTETDAKGRRLVRGHREV